MAVMATGAPDKMSQARQPCGMGMSGSEKEEGARTVMSWDGPGHLRSPYRAPQTPRPHSHVLGWAWTCQIPLLGPPNSSSTLQPKCRANAQPDHVPRPRGTGQGLPLPMASSLSLLQQPGSV